MTRRNAKVGRGKFLGFKLQDGDSALIEKLPDHFAAVLLNTLPYERRAQALNIPLGTLRSRLNRARSALVAAREAQE